MKTLKKKFILTRKKTEIKRKGNKKSKRTKILKNHIIFDLDETLIQSKFFDSNSESSDSDGEYIPDDIMSKHPNFKYSMGEIKGKFTEEYIIYHRPFLKELLDYCYKNYNVSILYTTKHNYTR